MQGYFGDDPSPLWPVDDNLFNGMTAIVLQYTPAGIIVAADGLSRWGDDLSRDELARQGETDHEQKIFRGAFGGLDIAWAASGAVFNRDKTFSLVCEITKALHAANSRSVQSFDSWLGAVADDLRRSVSDAQTRGLLAPFSENAALPLDSQERFTFARVFMAGYFYDGKPSIATIRLLHSNGVLTAPERLTQTPFMGIMYTGSAEIRKRYFGMHEDRRFFKYFRTPGEGLDHAVGYIEACSDPLAAEIDPLCKGIGGHIHAAIITPDAGFRWAIPPIEKAGSVNN
jgi:hypothetical protein